MFPRKTLQLILAEPKFLWHFVQKGSISAEHGIGFKKRDFVKFSKSDKAIDLVPML